MSQKFQRMKENFECERCGHRVQGDGFTNHCPKCLWSKHVDIHPGDRDEICHGLMEPIAVERKKDSYRIMFRCARCGIERWNKAAAEDDFEEMLRITQQHSEGEHG